MTSRRYFLKKSAVAMCGIGAVPASLARAAYGARAGSRRNKVLVAVFQRGGMDGLNVVVPFGEKRYYELRPTIAVSKPDGTEASAIDLDGFFGLHPSLAPLLPIYRAGHLAIVNAAGSPDPTRSHFDAQDFMESGTPGVTETSGWLNRVLLPRSGPVSPTRTVSIGDTLPLALRGDNHAVAIRFDRSSNGADYTGTRFGQSMAQIARMIKGGMGVEVAFLEMGGWDTHANEPGRLPALLSDFSRNLSAFHRDLGDLMADVILVTMSEFGRTAKENEEHGTDHGHANVMFVMGGDVNGGRIYGEWPGLEPEQLYQGRDLDLTTDFRDVLAEIVAHHLVCRPI